MIKPTINPESSPFRSEFQADPLAVSPQKNPFLNVLFIAALGMTLFDGSWLWVARAGWTLLAILISIHMRFGFYSLFFFAAFFHPTGFIPSLFFTLKHFQIAFLINLTVHAISGGNPLKTLLAGFKRAGNFYFPWLLILALALFNFSRFPASEQAWMTPINLLSIITAMLYLLGRSEQILLQNPREKTVQTCLSFFTAGVAVQVFIAFQNTVAGTLYFNMPLFHNNHVGILCAFSAFFPIGLFLSETDPLKRKFWAAATFVLISAVVASCSRTAWFSFLAGFTVFFVLAGKFQPKTHFLMKKRHTFSVALFVIAAAVTLSRGYEIVFYRFIGLIKLLDWRYWEYTFTDYQNFGFLGIFRLQQIYMIKDILQAQPFLGVGFIKDVMDFHGFYFSLLGGTGAVGFTFFVYFCRKTLHKSLARISNSAKSPESFFLLLSSFCALITWLICSFLETYVVQFSVWIIFWVLSALLYPVWPAASPQNENS